MSQGVVDSVTQSRRAVSGLETDGVAVSFLPQLLDRVPACEG